MWVIFGAGVGFALVMAAALLWSRRNVLPALEQRFSGASGPGSMIRRTVRAPGSGKGSPDSKGSGPPPPPGASQAELEELQYRVQRQLESTQQAQEEVRQTARVARAWGCVCAATRRWACTREPRRLRALRHRTASSHRHTDTTPPPKSPPPLPQLRDALIALSARRVAAQWQGRV